MTKYYISISWDYKTLQLYQAEGTDYGKNNFVCYFRKVLICESPTLGGLLRNMERHFIHHQRCKNPSASRMLKEIKRTFRVDFEIRDGEGWP